MFWIQLLRIVRKKSSWHHIKKDCLPLLDTIRFPLMWMQIKSTIFPSILANWTECFEKWYDRSLDLWYLFLLVPKPFSPRFEFSQNSLCQHRWIILCMWRFACAFYWCKMSPFFFFFSWNSLLLLQVASQGTYGTLSAIVKSRTGNKQVGFLTNRHVAVDLDYPNQKMFHPLPPNLGPGVYLGAVERATSFITDDVWYGIYAGTNPGNKVQDRAAVILR